MANKQDWKKTRTIYWSDERNDDFDEVGLSRPQVPENYNYLKKNFFFNGIYFFLYNFIAKPCFGLYCFFKGIRFKNKKNIKELHGKGAFIYCNHTAITDVFKFQANPFFFKRRINVLGYPDTLSMPFVWRIARGLGYMPVPDRHDLNNMKKLTEATKWYIDKKQFVLIYPEAHIWPYYTKIRNFGAGSFIYPAYANAPVIPVVTTWRKPKIGKKPKQTVYFGKVIFPDPNLPLNENKVRLHAECIRQMKEMSEAVYQYEYINYIHVSKDETK